MRRKKRWTDAEVEKLRSMVGKHSQDQIAQELGRPRGSVSTKAHELNLSLVFHRRQKPASMDPAQQGWTLADVGCRVACPVSCSPALAARCAASLRPAS